MGKRSTGRPKPPEVVLYVEGDDALRVPFQTFFHEWRERLRPRYSFKVVMGDSNNQTADNWRIGSAQAREKDIALLLIDSEGSVPNSPEGIPQGCASFLNDSDMKTDRVCFMV